MTPPGLPPGYFATPSQERVYNYWLDGKDNFDVDRRAADEMTQGCPGLRVMARENRAFVLGAVAWLGRNQGLRQFLDLGCGLPSRPAVHDAARDVIPGAAVAYVDADPLVVTHVRALQAGQGLAALEADVRDAEAVLGAGEVREVIDLSQPAGVILGGTLSDMPAGDARRAVQAYMEALAPGSAAVISCAHFDDGALAARLAGMFPGGTWRNHSREDVASFFSAAGLDPVRGEVADVRCWPLLPSGNGRTARVLGGVGIKD